MRELGGTIWSMMRVPQVALWCSEGFVIETDDDAASVPGLYQNRPPPQLILAFPGRTLSL